MQRKREACLILHGKKEKFKERKYAEILPYGKFGKFQYNEMESARFLMRLGASYEERIKGRHGSLKGEIAFIGKKRNGEYYNVDTYHRTTNQIADKDLCLIAEALVTVPNHIRVSEKDVERYEDLLLKNYKNSFKVKGNLSKERLAQEFLMALGYSWDAEGNEHDDIIRVQCEIFKDKLPRILQYVIYCRCYERIMETVNYCKDGILTLKCQNKQKWKLDQKYEEILQSYGIEKLDDDLNPVEDVLYDCRPYLKVVPNYQGIKPEFLCRMLNDILRLGDKQGKTIVDAFGGSGAISMNINENLKMEQIYNDLGIMNESLFKSLQKENRKALEERVEEFIKIVIEDTGNEKKAKGFFRCYEGILKKEKNGAGNDYDFVNDSFDTIRQKYRDKGNINGKREEEEQKERESRRKNYADMYGCLCKQKIGEHKIQEIEEFLLPLILEVKKIYRLLLNMEKKEVEDYKLNDAKIGFIFFVYNSFVARYQYSGATIDLLDRFVANYEQWLSWGSEVFENTTVESEDALELIGRRKDEEDVVWYCDIPYIGTSVQGYVKQLFETGKFINKLSECEGNYVVSSRFNIGDGGKEMSEEKKNGKYIDILRFYSSFLPKGCIQEYEEKVKKRFEIEEDSAKYCYISEGKEAKYILFAFTRTGRMHSLKKKEKTEETRETFRSNTLMKEDSIRRMLHNTQFGNIPVEIMLTDMKLDLDKMPVKKLGEEFVFWYMPTFATDNAYGVEPVTIIMKYENFVKQMLFRIVSKKVVDDIDTANEAAAFHEIFKLLMKNR